jgi:lysozyme
VNKVKIVGTGILAAIAMIGTWEGLRTEAYLDIGGVPTICYGHTEGVKMGDVSSREECRAQLRSDVQPHWDAVDRYITVPMKPWEQIAFTDLSFNIGTRAFAGSTLVKVANQGNMPAACLQLRRWVYDTASKYHPDPVPGLVKRRNFFFGICIGDGVEWEP